MRRQGGAARVSEQQSRGVELWEYVPGVPNGAGLPDAGLLDMLGDEDDDSEVEFCRARVGSRERLPKVPGSSRRAETEGTGVRYEAVREPVFSGSENWMARESGSSPWLSAGQKMSRGDTNHVALHKSVAIRNILRGAAPPLGGGPT